MGTFLRGLLVGIGLGFLVAPMRGQEMRRLLSERFQSLSGYLPDNEQLNQYTQQAKQTASTLKSSTVQVASQVKDTAAQVTSAAGQAVSNASQSAKNATAQVSDTVGQAASTVKQSTKDTAAQVSNTTGQAISNARQGAKDTATQVSNTTGPAASNAKQAVKDTVAQVSDSTATASSTAKQSAQDTLAQVSDAATQTSSNVKQGAKSVEDTAKQATVPTQKSTQTTTPTTQSTSAGESLSTIPGMEPEPQSSLEAEGIRTPQQLLERTRTKEERADLAQKIGMTTNMLRTLIDRTDLMRLQGVGAAEATMLEEAGVNGCKDLQRRNPEHLLTALSKGNGKGVSNLPDLDTVTAWIAEAMAMTHTDTEDEA